MRQDRTPETGKNRVVGQKNSLQNRSVSSPVWSKQYEVDTLFLNPHQRLGLVGLLNLMQDTAWGHVTHFGHGFQETLDKGLIWALVRLELHMKRWPEWGEQVRVSTWVRPIDNLFAKRDFEIHIEDERIGECASSWLTMDMTTRKPKKVNQDDYEMPFRGEGALSYEAKKIDYNRDQAIAPRFQSGFKVRNSDLDLNGHVNNTKYAEWVLDAIPFELHKDHLIESYEVNFIAETHAGDEIDVAGWELGSDSKFQFQGLRKSDQKSVFTSRLKTRPVQRR